MWNYDPYKKSDDRINDPFSPQCIHEDYYSLLHEPIIDHHLEYEKIISDEKLEEINKTINKIYVLLIMFLSGLLLFLIIGFMKVGG